MLGLVAGVLIAKSLDSKEQNKLPNWNECECKRCKHWKVLDVVYSIRLMMSVPIDWVCNIDKDTSVCDCNYKEI